MPPLSFRTLILASHSSVNYFASAKLPTLIRGILQRPIGLQGPIHLQRTTMIQLTQLTWIFHRDRSIHIERACSMAAVDKIKLIFIYWRFNISWIKKSFFENKNIFYQFWKCPSKPKLFKLSGNFLNLALSMCIQRTSTEYSRSAHSGKRHFPT